MFSIDTYITRRKALRDKVGSGLVIILGNNESPANYPNNCYTFRQDSSFLYFFGAQRDGLAGVIDIDNDTEYFLGDDIDIAVYLFFFRFFNSKTLTIRYFSREIATCSCFRRS